MANEAEIKLGAKKRVCFKKEANVSNALDEYKMMAEK